MKDKFGDRMKEYESASSTKLNGPYWVARLDGRSFSKLTSGLRRPYDSGFSQCMRDTTQELVKQTMPIMGYTQSDEITLIYDSLSFFDGKVQKLTSVLAGMCSAFFITELNKYHPHLVEKIPHFDCRVYDVPTKEELANSILWRVHDCRKNSISMAAQAEFSHKALLNKDSLTKIMMLEDIGESYWSLPKFFVNGTYFIREVIETEIDPELLNHFESVGRVLESKTFMRTKVKSYTDQLTFQKIMQIIS